MWELVRIAGAVAAFGVSGIAGFPLAVKGYRASAGDTMFHLALAPRIGAVRPLDMGLRAYTPTDRIFGMVGNKLDHTA